MSEQKRALVVDDSRSARLVLRRMLEKHGILVDTVESAADALEFLTRNRPDVIFMDHMMPGMDGFEAVRAIKDNPRTATIPVMMYTSRGGDLYLGQARALGAVGVLPKTVAPAELYASLQRIGLVSDRRTSQAPGPDEETPSERQEDLRRERGLEIPEVAAGFGDNSREQQEAPLPAQIRQLLDEQRVEIRKDLLTGLDTMARQHREKLDRLLDEKIAALREQLPPPAPRPSQWPMLVMGLLLAASLAWNLLPDEHRQTPAPSLAGQPPAREQPATEIPDAAPPTTATDNASRESGRGEVAPAEMTEHTMDYPWNAIALDGDRTRTVAELLAKLAASGFRGKLALYTHAGEFCLTGDAENGFRLAPDDTTLDRCSAIMNPVQPTDLPSTHQSLAFANLVASSPALQDGSIELEIHSLPRSEPLTPYPPREASTLAGDWNRAAAANNRVLLRLVPENPERLPDR